MARRRMLADELGDMLNPAPGQELDPDALFGEENGLIHGSDDELQRQLDEAPGRSALRLRAGIQLDEEDEEYRGRPTSRAALFGGDDFDGIGDEEGRQEEEEEEEEHKGAAAHRLAARHAVNGFGHTSDDEGGSDSGSDDDSGAPEEELRQRPTGGSGGGVRGRTGDAGGSDDEKEEGGSGSDEEGEGMVDALRRYQADPEMEELERQHAELREQAGEAAANAQQRSTREAGKARAVRSQKVIWERALEARIMLQRPVVAAPRLPRPAARAAALKASSGVRQGYTDLLDTCRGTLDALLDLHSALIDRHPQASAAAAAAAAADGKQQQQGDGVATANGKRSRSVMEADGASAESERAWACVEAAVSAAAPFRDGALDKWHRRTVLSSGTAALRGGGGLRALQQSVTVQVAALMRDAARLVTRTQLTRALAPRPLCEAPAAAVAAGEEDDEDDDAAAAERDPETFDDGEFYQQMLKELIEAGGVGGAAGGLAARAPKRRKVVDRRASKGRKLRFHVMDKLVGFCAPTDLAPPPYAAQLFSNLFGRAV